MGKERAGAGEKGESLPSEFHASCRPHGVENGDIVREKRERNGEERERERERENFT